MFADFLIAGENEAAMLVSITSGVTLESICEQFARVVNDAKYPGELAKILVNSGDFEIVARLIRKDVEPSLIESKAESYKMIINSFNAWLYLNESTITLMLKQTKLYMNVKPTIDFMEFMYKHMPHVDSLLYCPKKLEIEPGTKITANLANDLLYNSVLRLDRDGTELMIGKFGTQLTERQRIIITAKSEEHKNLLTYIDATAFW